MTRWEVASARGARDPFGGLGPTTFALSLVKNRRGHTGQWRLHGIIMSVPLPRRYLSLWLRRLATDRLRHPASAPDEDRPLVVTALVKSALRIVAMNDAAHALGLRSGMPLADARAMYPALAVAPSDPEADRRLLDAVADWCDRYTPLIGIDAPDGLVLDITGCAHLFGGEAALACDLLARLAAQSLHARAAIADTVGCAHAVARYGAASVVPSKEMRRALLALPVMSSTSPSGASMPMSGV